MMLLIVRVRQLALIIAMAILSASALAQTASTILDTVEDIHSATNIRAAFDSIEGMDAVNVQRLIEITEIPAPPFEESVRAADLLARLKIAGLTDAYIDEVGNVIARRPGVNRTQTVAFVAHLDTVFPAATQIKVRREGDRYFAPGIGDNTRGLVAMLCLIEVMEKHGIQTRDDILFVGSVGEARFDGDVSRERRFDRRLSGLVDRDHEVGHMEVAHGRGDALERETAGGHLAVE